MLVRVFVLTGLPGSIGGRLGFLSAAGGAPCPAAHLPESRSVPGTHAVPAPRSSFPRRPVSDRNAFFQARMNRKRPLSGVTIGNRPCSKRIATPASPSGRGGPLCLPQNIAPIPNNPGRTLRCAPTTQPTIPGRPDHHVHPTGNLNIR